MRSNGFRAVKIASACFEKGKNQCIEHELPKIAAEITCSNKNDFLSEFFKKNMVELVDTTAIFMDCNTVVFGNNATRGQLFPIFF